MAGVFTFGIASTVTGNLMGVTLLITFLQQCMVSGNDIRGLGAAFTLRSDGIQSYTGNMITTTPAAGIITFDSTIPGTTVGVTFDANIFFSVCIFTIDRVCISNNNFSRSATITSVRGKVHGNDFANGCIATMSEGIYTSNVNSLIASTFTLTNCAVISNNFFEDTGIAVNNITNPLVPVVISGNTFKAAIIIVAAVADSVISDNVFLNDSQNITKQITANNSNISGNQFLCNLSINSAQNSRIANNIFSSPVVIGGVMVLISISNSTFTGNRTNSVSAIFTSTGPDSVVTGNDFRDTVNLTHLGRSIVSGNRFSAAVSALAMNPAGLTNNNLLGGLVVGGAPFGFGAALGAVQQV